MEISKLTICRQDVIIVSDTETEPNEVILKKRKKCKRKTKCVRNVKLTTMTVNRTVPYCYRRSCRNSQQYHRQTSMNTKYQKQKATQVEMKFNKIEALTKNKIYKNAKNDGNINVVLTRDLYSPITIASSSGTYENVSSCSFNIPSSDSDELEDLINSTRKRMKNDNETLNRLMDRKSVCATTMQDDYQNISSDDEILDSSIHSMDTVLLYQGDTMPSRSRSPEHINRVHVKRNKNNNIEPMVLCRTPELNSNELLKQKIPRLLSQDNNNLSPLYEISGKVFMEHYLNTSFI